MTMIDVHAHFLPDFSPSCRRTRPRASGRIAQGGWSRPDPFLRWGRNVGQQNKGVPGVITNGGLICYTNLCPRSMQLARKLRFLNLLLAPERNRPPREQSFPRSEQMFELHGGAGPSGICAFS